MLISMLGLGEIQGVVLREETPSPCVETWLLSEVRDKTLDSGELLWTILLLFSKGCCCLLDKVIIAEIT